MDGRRLISHDTPLQLLQHADDGHLWPDDADPAGMTGWADATVLRAGCARCVPRRGERPAGYKIGFTNRGIWQRYQVFALIWGPVGPHRAALRRVAASGWHACASRARARSGVRHRVDTAARCQPSGLGCVTGLGQPWAERSCSRIGPDWKFTAIKTIADGALYARLLIGTAGAPSPVGARCPVPGPRPGC